MEARAGCREPNLANELAGPPHLGELPGHALLCRSLRTVNMFRGRFRRSAETVTGGTVDQLLDGGQARCLAMAVSLLSWAAVSTVA